MAKTPIWRMIAEKLTEEIAQDLYKEGDKLPTEAALAKRFGVNRHTVRHAIGALVEEGLLRSRRGAGVFVRHNPVEYPIGKRTRFRENLQANGRLPNRQLLRLETAPANDEQARNLQIEIGDAVLIYEGLSKTADAPFAHFSSYFPIARLPGIETAVRELSSTTEALKRCGIPDYLRKHTRITAERADAALALLLGLNEGDPILQTEGHNVDLQGVPVVYGRTRFSGDRIALNVSME